MTTNHPPLTTDFASDGIPLFLGDPNTNPQPTFPEYPWAHILAAADLIHEKYHRESWPPENEILRSIIESATVLDPINFDKHFIGWTQLDSIWGKNPDDAWDKLRDSLRPIKDLDRFTNPKASNPEYQHPKKHPADKPGPENIKNLLPSIQTPKTTKRGKAWRREPIWEKLWASSRAIFFALCLRAIWPEKPQSFPWAYAGVGKWIQGEGYAPGSLAAATGFSVRQTRRALRQLQSYGLIARITRGRPSHTQTGKPINGYTGVSKYWIFFTPEMSAAFTAIAKNKKRIHKPGRLN